MRPLMPPVQTPDNLFHDGNPLTGELGTIVDSEHLNNVQSSVMDVQSELISVLTAAGIETDPAVFQLLSALQKLFAENTDSLGALAGLVGLANKLPYFTGANTAALTTLTSIGRDLIGKNTIADILTYLGLGAGAPAIGVPFFWPSSAMPNTVMDEWAGMVFLKFNGATFSAATYPKLALVFPALLLPEARGEFLRIWDDGRGVDSGRALLSAQGFAIQNITGRLRSRSSPLAGGGAIVEANGAFTLSTNTGGAYVTLAGTSGSANADETTFDASRVANTASETRSRNIAFNFLVRAK